MLLLLTALMNLSPLNFYSLFFMQQSKIWSTTGEWTFSGRTADFLWMMIFGAFSLLVCVILIYVLLLFSLFSFSSTCTTCMYSQPLTLPSEIITRCLVRFHDWLAHTYMSVWQNSLFFLFFSLFFASYLLVDGQYGD